MRAISAWFVLLGLAAAPCAAQVANLTGTWKLNVAKSTWGQKQKPATITLQIEHREPELKYAGMVVDTHGDGRNFEFRATLDGKAYPFTGPYGEGTITFRRVGANTTASWFRSSDGSVFEDSQTSLSHNGKVLTHRVHLKDANGVLSWTEVYEKQ